MAEENPLRKENLVVLMYTSPYSVGFVDLNEFKNSRNDKIGIDLEARTWSIIPDGVWRGPRSEYKEIPIGKSISSDPIIGVYDITNREHIQKMVSVATSATRDSGRESLDD